MHPPADGYFSKRPLPDGFQGNTKPQSFALCGGPLSRQSAAVWSVDQDESGSCGESGGYTVIVEGAGYAGGIAPSQPPGGGGPGRGSSPPTQS